MKNERLIKQELNPNAFKLLRMICAFQVFLGHASTHLQLPSSLLSVIGEKFFLIFQGVPIFFGLSGFFIWKSLCRKPTLVSFAKRRWLRLYPELWIVVLCSAIILLVSIPAKIQPLGFTAWIITQSTFLQFWTPDSLSSYGVGCPNGSLWTICVFVQFYIVVWILFKVLHDQKIGRWLITMGIAIAMNVVPKALLSNIPTIIYKLYEQTIFPYLIIFIVGAFLSEFFSEIKSEVNILFIISVILLGASIMFPGLDMQGVRYPIIRSILLVVFAVTFGYALSFLKVKYDFSYELYLVHMIVINVFVQAGKIMKFQYFIETFLLSVFFAIVLQFINNKIQWKKLTT